MLSTVGEASRRLDSSWSVGREKRVVAYIQKHAIDLDDGLQFNEYVIDEL